MDNEYNALDKEGIGVFRNERCPYIKTQGFLNNNLSPSLNLSFKHLIYSKSMKNSHSWLISTSEINHNKIGSKIGHSKNFFKQVLLNHYIKNFSKNVFLNHYIDQYVKNNYFVTC